MILRLLIKNFLSFDEYAQFDMFPNVKKATLREHVKKIEGEVSVLKMAAIYGANGAGKSNLLEAIDFLKQLTTVKNFLNMRNVENFFFALKKEAGLQPIELAIEFATKTGLSYIYAVDVARNGICTETLHRSGLGRRNNEEVFSRQGDMVSYALPPSEEVQKIVEGWMQKNPFASLLTINNDMPVLTDENIIEAHKWFSDELVVLDIHSSIPHLIQLMKDNEQLNLFAKKLFSELDLGINDVRVETEDFDEWASTHDVSDIPLDRIKSQSEVLSHLIDNRPTHTISIENGVRKISQLLFEQFGKDEFTHDMDIRAQSDGTVRLLMLIPALYDAIKAGKTVIIDEIDHSIHPHIVCELVRYFSMQSTTGQLIFTTHQTCLLNQDFLRTDEVWLVEKSKGGSHVYSLNDFKIHHTINIENGYLDGRYGAIPFVGELNI